MSTVQRCDGPRCDKERVAPGSSIGQGFESITSQWHTLTPSTGHLTHFHSLRCLMKYLKVRLDA